jgi:CBS-domain-containing membrane protein
VRWLSERDMRGDRVPSGEPPHPSLVTVELDDVMRDALGDLLDAESRYAPVLDERGCAVGVLSMEVIAHALHLPPEEARSSADLVEDASELPADA